MRIACRLRELREALELSLRDVEEASGVNRGSLSAIETGHALPLDEWIPKLEDVYGAPVTDWYSPAVLLVLEYPERP